MGRKIKQLKNYTIAQVEKLYKSKDEYHVGVKLLAIIKMCRGMSSRQVSEMFEVSFKQVCNWADAFDKYGVEGLKIQPGRGRKRKMDKDIDAMVEKDIATCPETFGYNTSNWSGPLLKDFLLHHYNIDYSISAVYALLHRLGYSFQRVKATYAERDEKERTKVREEIKKNFN